MNEVQKKVFFEKTKMLRNYEQTGIVYRTNIPNMLNLVSDEFKLREDM